MQNYDRPITKTEIKGLVGRDDPLMCDVGCNNGDDAVELIKLFPEGKVWCFEPDPRAIESFKGTVSDSRCVLIEAAVGAVCGTADFYVSGGQPPAFPDLTDWTYSGSIHKPTGHLITFPWCTFPSTIKVTVVTLDSLLDRLPLDRLVDFIWADVQGAEGDLIRGASQIFERTRYFYSEFYDTPMYDGQINLHQMCELLPTWECIAVYGGNALFQNKAH